MLFVEMWIDCITVNFWQIKKAKIQFPTFINFSLYKTVYIFACLLYRYSGIYTNHCHSMELI